MDRKINSSLVRSKRIDPITVLPEDAIQEIFSYLDIDDIHICSYVSKRWNRAVGNLKKIYVVFDSYDVENFHSLIQSSRKYRHIFITMCGGVRMEKSMHENMINRVLLKFSDSLESINTSFDISNITCQLPKLREVSINRFFDKKIELYRNGVISANLKNLEILDIGNVDRKSLKFLKETLKHMRNLKKLYFSDNIFDATTLEEFNFPNLEHLCLKGDDLDLSYNALTFIMTKLPSLKKLDYEGCARGRLPDNFTVTSLCARYSFLSKYLKSFKCVEVVGTECLDLSTVKMLLKCTTLKKVNFARLEMDEEYSILKHIVRQPGRQSKIDFGDLGEYDDILQVFREMKGFEYKLYDDIYLELMFSDCEESNGEESDVESFEGDKNKCYNYRNESESESESD